MPQTRPRPSPRFSWYRCVFSKENEKFSADAPQLQEDSVEAVQSLSPGARPRCCGAESGCTHAATKHGDGCGDQGDGVRPEARQMSKRVCCGRCPSLRPVQFCWFFWGGRGSVAVQQRFLGHVQVWIYSERSPCKQIGAPRRNRKYPGYEQALEWNRAKRSSLSWKYS